MKQLVSPASTQPDDGVRSWLKYFQVTSLFVIFLLGISSLAGWIIAPLGKILPHAVFLMRANTSLLVVFSGLSAALAIARSSRQIVRASQALGVFVTLFALLILLKDFSLIHIPIETLLAPDSASIFPGKVSPEAAGSFILLGIVLTGLRTRKSLLSHLTDAVALLLFLAMLIFLARYFFGLSHLFILHQNNPFSQQTLVCLLLLTALALTRRADSGVFSILLDNGSGGMTARLATPFAILLPFAIAVPRALLVRVKPEQESSATAVATSLLAISAVSLVLVLAWRTKAFEATVRELSLRDELTTLYNRRGFYVLAEQAFLIAQRSSESFTIIFIDMDGLKHVNDTLGHEAGSAMLREMADLLKNTFRKTDVIGRIGGDEFVVAGESNDPEMKQAIARLTENQTSLNILPNRKYHLQFSRGVVASEENPSLTFEALVAKADNIMYEQKRAKRLDEQKRTNRRTRSAPSRS